MRPKGRKAATYKHQTKSARKSAASPVQRKYSSIYMSRTTPTSTAKKSVPPAVQLARAIKCLDVFGKHDPDAASFYAQRKYDDADMAREFKALSATNPLPAATSSPKSTWTRSSSFCTPRPSSLSWALRKCLWLTAI